MVVVMGAAHFYVVHYYQSISVPISNIIGRRSRLDWVGVVAGWSTGRHYMV